MEKQLLFYEKVVPISKQRHLAWSIGSETGYRFATETNSVPLMSIEFAKAAGDYPIVFTESNGIVMPTAVLGLERSRNLYVKADGTWNAGYVPAFVRRYPFVFSTNDEGKTFTLCLDETYPGCDAKGKTGQRLFTEAGDRTEFLERMLTFVNSYQTEHRRSRAFGAKLKELGLLEPMQAQVTLPTGDQRSMTGFMAVSRERLKALAPEQVQELFRLDGLELIYLHLFSMENFQKLVRLSAH
jgi:hypothetical protein